MEKDLCALIFARGGSKGVKNKNIRSVNGKPLIAHSIACALGSRWVGRVIVSTDSAEIGAVARQSGAEVLERPKELASDAVPELLAWRHAIETLGSQLNSVFISLPATSPLRNSEDVDRAVEEFRKGRCDVLFGISPSHHNPYLDMVKITDRNFIEVVIPGSGAARRQDTPEIFDVTSCVYVGDVDYLLRCRTIMEGRVGHITIPPERALDINTEFDLSLADLILRNR